MIIVQITPIGVREISVEAANDRLEDADLALWPLIREELARLDSRLRSEGPGLLKRLDPAGGRSA
jgi:hypothetical protein